MEDAIKASGSQVITTSLRRQSPEHRAGKSWWNSLQKLGCYLLPNTAGCRTSKEAVAIAEMSREIFETDWIKLEVTGDEYTLQPDPYELIQSTQQLLRLGFKVFAYTTDDLVVCTRLWEMGCEVVMPWGSPIGTGKGLMNAYSLATIRDRLPNVKLLVDAGIGVPSHASQAMEFGCDGVLLNTAVAQADCPVQMSRAMRHAVIAGRLAYLAGPMATSETATTSTPLIGRPFWQAEESKTTRYNG